MRAKFIYEKFTQDSDPIDDLGIGMKNLMKNWFKTKENKLKYHYVEDDLIWIFAEHGKTDFVKHLLKKHNYGQDGYIEYAVSMAITYEHPETLRVLLDVIQDIHFNNDMLFHWAKTTKNEKIRKILYDRFKKEKNIIDEKFIQDSDPIRDLNIGIDINRVFEDRTEAAEWIYKYLPHILGTKEIPEDIILDDEYFIKEPYLEKIKNYAEKYFKMTDRLGNDMICYPSFKHLNSLLHEKGFKESLNEKFTEDGDPIHDMGIGLKSKLKTFEEKYRYVTWETVTPKDKQRIKSLVERAEGNPEKECMYAINMANAIRDLYKAYRRYLAAKNFRGESWDVTNIFLKRLLELAEIL